MPTRTHPPTHARHPIEEALAERGETVQSFALEIGVSDGHLRRVLRGQTRPSRPLQQLVAILLDRPVSDLFGGLNEPS